MGVEKPIREKILPFSDKAFAAAVKKQTGLFFYFVTLTKEVPQDEYRRSTKNSADSDKDKIAATAKKLIHKSKGMREHQTQEQIDQTLKDSFPASDPPGWY